MGDGVAELGMPSVLRVVLGFLLTAGLAVAAAFAARRFWPGINARAASGKRVRPLGHSMVSRTLTVHLVEVDGARIVIAEGRNGVGVSVLTPPNDAGKTIGELEQSS